MLHGHGRLKAARSSNLARTRNFWERFFMGVAACGCVYLGLHRGRLRREERDVDTPARVRRRRGARGKNKGTNSSGRLEGTDGWVRWWRRVACHVASTPRGVTRPLSPPFFVAKSSFSSSPTRIAKKTKTDKKRRRARAGRSGALRRAVGWRFPPLSSFVRGGVSAGPFLKNAVGFRRASQLIY